MHHKLIVAALAAALPALAFAAAQHPAAGTKPHPAPSAQATAALRTILTGATDCDEPTERNSNLLPVKAKGLVRLRSERSTGRGGNVETPTSIKPLFLLL